MRLIDADALKYTMLYKENFLRGTGVEALAVWKSDVDDMPTIDAVPVVRCQECIYNTNDVYHECIEFGIRIPDDAEFFCKYGKRRKEEHMCGHAIHEITLSCPSLPTIDAVPVVRCRECKCYPKDFDENSLNWCCGIGDETKPNDFCSYGQRREEEHNAAD